MYGLRVNGTKAKRMVASGAKLLDVRDAVKFRDGTIPGAVNLPLRRISEMQRYDRRTKFVLFGDGPEDEDALQAAKYLGLYGFSDVYILDSKEAWDK